MMNLEIECLVCSRELVRIIVNSRIIPAFPILDNTVVVKVKPIWDEHEHLIFIKNILSQYKKLTNKFILNKINNDPKIVIRSRLVDNEPVLNGFRIRYKLNIKIETFLTALERNEYYKNFKKRIINGDIKILSPD